MRVRIFTVGLLSALLISGCNIINISKPAPNNNPLIESVTCTNDVFAMTDSEMACQASDPDGDSLQYEWSTGSGKIIGTGARMMWVSPDTMGDYDFTVRVSDGKGERRNRLSPYVCLPMLMGQPRHHLLLKCY